MVRSAHSGILGHVSVPSLMNLYFTSAQQSGQPSGPNQGTFSSHQPSNTKSVSGPGTSISYTGGLGVGFIHHRRTEDWEGYGRMPATAGYEMSSMTAARNQQYSGAAGFCRSRSTASRALDVNTASEDQIRYRELSGLDFAVFQGDFSSQTPYTPRMSLPSENGRINNGSQPTVAFFQAVDDLNYTEHRNSQSYIDRPGPYISAMMLVASTMSNFPSERVPSFSTLQILALALKYLEAMCLYTPRSNSLVHSLKLSLSPPT